MRVSSVLKPLSALGCCLALCVMSGNTSAGQSYLLGRGSADITGPLVGLQLWGFGRPDQIGEGLHIRQRSRAFVVAQADDSRRRLVFVSADLGSIDHHITLAVTERLQQRYGEIYDLSNVLISATHTHAAPGGYWQSRTATGLDGGLYPEHFNAIVAGITASIVQAHENLGPGDILINTGRVGNAGVNRSLIAYQENPAAERARYVDNTNTSMTLLKFVDDSGAVGMINWYALHPTAMNYYNRLVSGDHKGYASLQMERQFGGNGSPGDFVAAFAQADPGDVTPNTNLDNTGPGATDVETTRIMGDRQLQVARQLFDEATEKLSGPVDTRHIYVDLSHYAVEPRFTGQGTQHTCPSAYGYSFAGGSTEDGGGHFLFREGMTEQSLWRDWLIRLVLGTSGWTESVRACQAPKPILLETGTGDPPLQSQIRSIALARIGQLVILGLPAEVTTMAGRRLRDTVMAELGDWAGHIVLAGYVNGYAGYITTPQEYMIQQYEAGHTLHGRWTLPAYQQVAAQLAAALEQGKSVTADIAYDDWRGKSVGRSLPDGVVGEPPQGRHYGEARPVLADAYRPGETPVAEFWSANPTLHYLTGENYLRVERKGISGWQVVAEDGDWATTLRWVVEDDAYVARASWTIPEDAAPGDYRFSHSGFDPSGKRFSGSSTLFRVIPRGP